MRRIAVTPRHDWKATAERHGFTFHTMYGAPYWVEDAVYAFTLREIEDELEAPSAELWEMCLEVVRRAVRDDEILASLAIPRGWWDAVADSWRRRDRDVYARFDLAYGTGGPAKLLECNADTPTSVYEAAFFQWLWLEEARARGIVPAGTDQFNTVQEALIDGFASLQPLWGPCAGPQLNGHTLHFASVRGNEEDRGTILYLRDCAHQAGLRTGVIAVEDIGVDAEGRLTDLEDRPILALFKLYPWEWLVDEPFGVHLKGALAPLVVEPAWKMVLSNKGLLVWLWRMFPGHPNLLPAAFAGTPDAAALGPRVAVKPLLSREGANVRLLSPDLPGGSVGEDGPYGAEGFVVQELHPLPVFDGSHHAVVGSWIAAGRACGIGMREDDGPVTKNLSRFLPHVIV